MALIFGAAIILFTYIPGISAKSIGLGCQKQRLTRLIIELKLTDVKTGKLSDDIDIRRIKQDSLLCGQYKDFTSVVNYVRDEIGNDDFEKLYGEWSHPEYSFNYNKSKNLYNNGNWYERRKPVDLGDYRIMLPNNKYTCNFGNQKVVVKNNDMVVLEYPINSIIRKDTMLLHHPEQLLTCRNDSLMLVLQSISIEDTIVTDVRSYDFQLFKKRAK